MSKRRNSPDVARRNFLKGAGLVGAAALTPAAAKAQVAAPQARPQGRRARTAADRRRDPAALARTR